MLNSIGKSWKNGCLRLMGFVVIRLLRLVAYMLSFPRILDSLLPYTRTCHTLKTKENNLTLLFTTDIASTYIVQKIPLPPTESTPNNSKNLKNKESSKSIIN